MHSTQGKRNDRKPPSTKDWETKPITPAKYQKQAAHKTPPAIPKNNNNNRMRSNLTLSTQRKNPSSFMQGL